MTRILNFLMRIVASMVLFGCCSVNDPEIGMTIFLQNPKASDAGGSEKESLSSISLAMPEFLNAEKRIVEGNIIITIAPDWHTYGNPPGDSGMAPIFNFTLPDGWKSEILRFPPPKTFVEKGIGTTYGYEKTVKIPFRLTAPKDLKLGESLHLKLSAQWLICKEICMPMSGDVEATVNIVKKGK